ncbi:MAG: hypothetical protein UR60_C0017G0025 [Candidatus Moranbacteria bacterium GW2011_GWF2_34_56]|nr:MAG: hypothetical protein UR51_C0015G0011 [Candidatus Moranbacteria bacterium GW2011_GWF1_34_10]KKP64687.1 MAG: hypothetical protein UR60_C0017G0025 [Candidatus Moranbacteria bacterium GW2011_GWF2_34_56]HBI17602.1 hypothetical protein [Candidatus Moranbacteria bacterium]
MNEGAINEIRFNDNVFSERLYRDRFVFPEALIVLFKDSDEIVEAMEREIEERIKNREINNFSNEVILKNIAGPFYGDLSEDEQAALVKVIGEIKNDKINNGEEKAPIILPKKEVLADDELKRMIRDSANLLSEEAKRAGVIGEVERKSNGDIDPKGDAEALDERIKLD